ncbi:MAG: helix-turn-helix transcriptional regulator [Phycisphaerae bacterium]|nr:helix-turn-helix transcriptional regulator [Phycisphaerae bacterium]
MFQEYAWSSGPAGVSGLDLKRIWRVEADETYRPYHEKGRDDIVVIRTLGGEGWMQLDGVGEFVLPAGSVLFVEGPRIRRYHPTRETWNFWWFECCIHGPLHFPLHEVMRVRTLSGEAKRMRECFALLGGREFLSRACASSILAMLMYEWTRRWHGQVRPPSENRRLVDRAIERMREDFARPINVSQLARQAGMSERWFRRIFRDVTGQSPKAYYDALRLDAAAELLQMGQNNLAQIAERLGFSSPFHLSRAFKARHGLSPSAYRKQ